MVTPLHLLLTVATVAILLLIGMVSGRHINDAHSFSVGGNASSWMVCGIIMGTLVGGQSTVGTAQMAFSYGFSAWNFTLGTALGALILGIFMVHPLRRRRVMTLGEILADTYGAVAERVSSILSLLGIFVSIVAQVLAAAALATALTGLSSRWAALLSSLFIVLFVFFGGIRSAGIGGVVKVALLYFSCLLVGGVVWHLSGGLRGLFDTMHHFLDTRPQLSLSQGLTADTIGTRYGNLFSRGAVKDVGAIISLILGVLSTQTYAQALWAARNDRAARNGALAAALLTSLIGFACMLVGIYMRCHTLLPDEPTDGMPTSLLHDTAAAFPTFVLTHLPPALGGIVLGTLLVTILGGGSGLTLGAATIVVRDIFPHRNTSLPFYRIVVVLLVGMATAVALLVHQTLINELGFLSLGLRATALVFPLLFALACPGHFRPNAALASMVLGTAAMIAAHLSGAPLDPSWWGLGVGLIVMLLGWDRKGSQSC